MDDGPLSGADWGGDGERRTTLAVRGWRCATCAAWLDVRTAFPWRCPNATAGDRRHVLRIVRDPGPPVPSGVPMTLMNHDHDLAWAAFAAAHGTSEVARHSLVMTLEESVRSVAGVGFRATPCARSDELSDRLGFGATGGVWVKDETHNVAGSQKARHLATILLHLLAAEELELLPERPDLAIASCGNAALAAATLARAVDWPLDVYVPEWMSDAFGRRLDELGARIHRCPRRATDPPGDPSLHRFREAVAAGAIPFTVQGPENALCLDGGRTIGWEIAEALGRLDALPIDRVFAQVGGGAFATCLADGLTQSIGPVRFHAVQAEGCAPLARAWDRAGDRDDLAAAWDELMTAWESPTSVADGILDDETYDWLGIFRAMREGGGSPVVAAESAIVEAHDVARAAGFDVSPTGSAGLAGLLALRDEVAPSERVVIVMSGIGR